MSHGSRALRAVPSSRRSHELQPHSLYGREVHVEYGVEIQGDDRIHTRSERRSS